jgi:hypothetical protein
MSGLTELVYAARWVAHENNSEIGDAAFIVAKEGLPCADVLDAAAQRALESAISLAVMTCVVRRLEDFNRVGLTDKESDLVAEVRARPARSLVLLQATIAVNELLDAVFDALGSAS